MIRAYYSSEAVCELLELPRGQLRRYVRAGLVSPSGEQEQARVPRRFAEEDVRRIRRIRRLQRDLGLNLAAVQVALQLIDQIDDLQRRLGNAKR